MFDYLVGEVLHFLYDDIQVIMMIFKCRKYISVNLWPALHSPPSFGGGQKEQGWGD